MRYRKDPLEWKDCVGRFGAKAGASLLAAALIAPSLASAQASGFGFPGEQHLRLDGEVSTVPPQNIRIGTPKAPSRESLSARRDAGRATMKGAEATIRATPQRRRAPLVIVDDDFAGSSFGDGVFFNDPGLGVQAGSFGVTAFATIQDAIDAVDDGGTVLVAGGEYFEESNAFPGRALTVTDKSVTLLGPNNGVCASDGSPRFPEATIYSEVQAFDTPIPIVGFFSSAADGSTVDGFAIEGDNPMLSSGFVINGAEFDADIAFLAFQTEQITFVNNVVQNVRDYAVAGFYNNGIGEESLFACNWANNIIGVETVSDEGVGFVAARSFHVDILDNLATNTRTGIQTNQHITFGAAREYTIANNVIEASHRGIYYNFHEAPDMGWNIIDNSVTCVPQSAYGNIVLPWEAIRIESIFDDLVGFVSGNTLEAGAALADARYVLGVTGVNIVPNVTSANISLADNTILNHRRGVLLQADITVPVSNHPQISGGSATGVEARAGLINLTGSNLEGNATGILADGGDIVAFENSISNGDFGVVITNGGTVNLCQNDFTNLSTWNIDNEASADPTAQVIQGSTFDGTGDGVRNQGAGTLDATGNYWGSPLGPNTMTSNSTDGDVAFIPFQLLPDSPAIGPCQGDVTLVCEDINGANYELPVVAVGDTCDGTPGDVTVTYEIPMLGMSGLMGGDVVLFPIGVTDVMVIATDPNGPPAVCEFTVEVLDDPIEPGRFPSIAAHDGYLQESSPGSGIGFLARSNLVEARIGDDANNRQWRSLLSFDTSSLPEDRTVTSARIRLTVTSQFGDPSVLGDLLTDMGVPSLGTASLTPDDFEAIPTYTNVSLLTPLPPVGGKTLYVELGATALAELETADAVQFRFQFANATDGDGGSDGFRIGTGEYGANHPFTPELIVEYDILLCDGCGEQGVDSGDAMSDVTDTFVSIGSDDGFITESEEDAGVGNTANYLSNVLLIGDTDDRQQLIGLLSFNTASIPADAFIVSAELRLNAFTTRNDPDTLGDLVADMRCPNKGSIYGPTSRAETPDFQAFSFLTEVANLGTAPNPGGSSIGSLNGPGLQAINRDGVTQFKLRYELEDNDDTTDDYVNFFSGNEPSSQFRPTLEVVWRPAP